MTKKTAIVAGRGWVPKIAITACQERGHDVHVIALKGETDPEILTDVSHSWHDIAAVGGIIKAIKVQDCTRVCLVGPINRPQFSKLRPDLKGALLLPKVIAAARRGDDALLTVVVAALEEEGLSVVGADSLFEGLTVGPGTLTHVAPDDGAMADIDRGLEVLRLIGAEDIGQAVVIRDGRVMAVEAAEGTDEMIKRCGAFRLEAPAGVLVKIPKPGQERRVDLPAIGRTTVENVVAAGLAGIAIEAHGALIFEREEMVELANQAGIFIHVLPGTKDAQDAPAP